MLHSHCTKTVTESSFLFLGKKNEKSPLTERKQGDHQILLSVSLGLLNQLKTFLMVSQKQLPQPSKNYHTLHWSLNAFFPLFASSESASSARAQHLPALPSQGSCGFSSAHYFPGARICPLSAAGTDTSLEKHRPGE